jgi:pilus assembly protein FimV
LKNEIIEVESLINESRYFEAHHAVDALLKDNPNEERLQQLMALSLSKLGDNINALEYFEFKWQTHKNNAESAGIIGSIYKSLFIKTQEPDYGKKSAAVYLHSFNATQSYYTGINAATMSKITGGQNSKVIAQQLVEMLLPLERNYWQEATLAEAYFLLKDIKKSTDHYILTREMMGNNWGAINSVCQQLWLLDHYAGVPKTILQFFKPPIISSFIGHMIDAPSREKPRFPSEMEENVRSAIRSIILTYDIQIGYSSLACGSDILFIEEMFDLGREVEILLPFQIDDFIQTSVAFAGDHWVERFNNILAKVDNVHYLLDEPFSGDDYQYRLLALQISGLSMIRAEMMHTSPHLLAVLSEFSLEAKTGGARDLINIWPEKDNIHTVNIDKHKAPDVKPKPSTYNLLKSKEFKYDEEKPVSFVLAFDLLDDIEIFERILENQSPSIYQKTENKVILGFLRLPFIVRFLTDFMSQVDDSSSYKASLTIGVINLKGDNVLENDIVKKAISFCERSSKNSFLINEAVASIMIVNTKNIFLTYKGEIKLESGQSENVYNMTLKEVR